MDKPSLLERYRDDRRKLLEFLLSSSSGLITELRTPAGPTTSLSGINFDTLSSDYILHSLKSGGVVDLSEATKKYFADLSCPILVHSGKGSSYFLLTDPEWAGSPPKRAPPPIISNENTVQTSQLSKESDCSIHDKKEATWNGHAVQHESKEPVKDVDVLTLGLPCLNTGLSDDDLRESAYVILLASMAISGIEIHIREDRKREKSKKLLSGLRHKKDKVQQQPHSNDKYSEHIDIIRIQMEISETMDICIRRRLMQLARRKAWDQMDIPQVALGLLSCIVESDFLNEKSYMRWKNAQVGMLEELLCYSSKFEESECQSIHTYLAKIRNAKEWDHMMSHLQHDEVLLALTQSALKLSSVPGKFGIESETYYWIAGYHLNIRLYEKLLFGLFDILDEGQLIEEAEEILKLIKLTWSTLGVTEKIHDLIYGWVLFNQYVRTSEATLMEYSILELKKALSTEHGNLEEQKYVNSLACSRDYNGYETEFSLVQAVCFSISVWCDFKLSDYHLHFDQKPDRFRMVIALLSEAGIITSIDCGGIQLTTLSSSNKNGTEKIRSYVESSISAAYGRAAYKIDLGTSLESRHPLALLADEVRLIAHRELNLFCPVLIQWFPECGMAAAELLHKIYGERLEPFLRDVPCLAEDVKPVLKAANLLEHDLAGLFAYACEANVFRLPPNQDLGHYRIGEVAKPIILDWMITQSVHVLEWSGRAFDLEEWEPVSLQQKQAASIVEVFRIIEETVDQFFGLNLPMDITHLQALLSVIFHCLDPYLLKLRNHIVEKNHLYPPDPPLTRYTESTIPIMKKKLIECIPLDKNIIDKLNSLPASKLCVRLNTLRYIQKQISVLEDSIRKSWAVVNSSENQRSAKGELLDLPESNTLTFGEAMDELFVTTFDYIRDAATSAISLISDFTGTKIVYWDLRDTFLFSLYRGNTEDARLETVLPSLNNELDLVCGLTDDTLRDNLVLNIYRATLEGYVWVLLDGGPSRAFSDSDLSILEDDLSVLKEFFIAEGEGLPRTLVEEEAKHAKQILSLYSLETEALIQMLMSASEQITEKRDSNNEGCAVFNDARTLIRVLCHKKDREASKFLKRVYEFPMSSEYDDTPSDTSDSSSPFISDFLKRSASIRWTDKGHYSFKSFKKRFL